MGVIPDANDLPPNSAQWKRYVDQEITNLRSAANNASLVESNSLSALQNNFNLLRTQVQKLPVVASYGANNKGGGLFSSSYVTVVETTIQCPPDKNVARILAIGTGVYLDTVTGGVTTSYGRLTIGGAYPSPDFPATKDSGASQVNNVISTHASWFVRLVPGAYYKIIMDARALNPSAFPANAQNFADLSVLASFTYRDN